MYTIVSKNLLTGEEKERSTNCEGAAQVILQQILDCEINEGYQIIDKPDGPVGYSFLAVMDNKAILTIDLLF